MSLVNESNQQELWSVNRLICAYDGGEKLPFPIRVGGEVFSQNDGYGLASGEHLMLLNVDAIQNFESLVAEARFVEVLVSEVFEGSSGLQAVGRDCKILQKQPDMAKHSFLDSKVSVSTHAQWARFKSLSHDFFVSKNLLPVQSPSLVVCPGTEPTLDPVEVRVDLGGKSLHRYLPTSPELHLKKCVAAGWGDVFEIKSCFRAEELTPMHEPEFTMIEWYRTFSGLEQIVTDFVQWLDYLKVNILEGAACPDVKWVSLSEVFIELFGVELTPNTTAKELFKICESSSVEAYNTEGFNDLFFRLLVEKIDPWLREQLSLVVLYNYPPSQAALAKINNEGWADRLEIYWHGIELGNAFNELTDPVEQLKRFKLDNKQKQLLGKKEVSIDEEFLKALKYGMPPTAGIAMGMERVFMAFMGLDKIQSLHPFNWRWQMETEALKDKN